MTISKQPLANATPLSARSKAAAFTPRAQAILRSPDARGRKALAIHLATSTDLSEEQACAILAAAPRGVGHNGSEKAQESAAQKIVSSWEVATGGAHGRQ